MAKYLKTQNIFRFGELLDNTNERRIYINDLSFTCSTPYIFYLWLINHTCVIFYRRPRNITRNSIVEKVSVFFNSRKDARNFAFKKVDYKILKRIFKPSKHIIL